MKHYLLSMICVFLYSSINAQNSSTYNYKKDGNTRIFTVTDSNREIIIVKGSNYRKAVNISSDEKQIFIADAKKNVKHILDKTTGDTLGNISYKSGETITLNGTTFQVGWEGKELYYSTNNQKVLRATYEKGKVNTSITLLMYEERPLLEYFALNKMIHRLDTQNTTWAPTVLLGLVGVMAALNQR